MGIITAGMGAVLKHIKKGKKAKRTVFKAKPDLYIKQFKKSKKHGLGDKIGVWSNREAGKTITEIGSGVNVKFKKSGMPYVPKGTKSSILTRGKGAVKLESPIAAGLTVSAIRDKGKQEKKKK